MKQNKQTLIRGWAAALLLATALLMPQVAAAYDFMVGGLCYNRNSDGTSVTVTYQNSSSPRYSNLSGDLVIPATVTYSGTTYSVTAIGESAFDGCGGLTSVTIPYSVTSIDNYAFLGCSGLTSVTIPNSVTSIGWLAFSGCSGLTSVTIGNSVTFIGQQAFEYCSGLTSLTIGNSVTSIGNWAFRGCSGLTSVTIPNSVTTIGSCAFSGCSGLESMVVEAGNSRYDSRDNCNAIIETATNTLIAGCKSAIIGNSVTSIGYSAFENCSGLTSVTIPNSVTSIGCYAFKDCSGLTSVTIGNSVTNLDIYAFQNCSGLTSVTWNAISCNNNYSYSPFSYSASGITSFTFGNDVEKIPSGLCAGFTGLSSIIIPNSVTSIGEKAFRGCSGLTSVTIGNSVTSIGENAFYNCGKLSSVHISDLEKWCNISFGGSTNYYYSTDDTYANPISIAKHLYLNGTEVEDLVIPNSVFTINKLAFYSCYGLKSVTIPNSVTTIGDGAFSYCYNLISVDISDSLTKFGYRSFCGCSGLTSVTIPNSVTSIGESAFLNCSGLTSVFFNAKKCYGGYSYNSPFSGCSSITNFTFAEGVEYIPRMLCKNLTGLTSVEIPSSVTWIDYEAFYGCSLSSVTIPSSAKMIGYSVFDKTPWYNNQPDGMVYADCVAYKYKGTMPANTEITLNEGTLVIAGQAFKNFTGLESIVIPESVSYVGEEAFYGCSNLKNVYCYVDDPSDIILNGSMINSDYSLFNYVPKTMNVYVPYGSSDLYRTAEIWKDFNIVEMGPPTVLATSVTLNKTAAEVTAGETLQLTATVLPEDATDKSVTWTSSDENVATVDENGLVTAVAAGTATITATTNDGGAFTATCAVTVNPAAILATSVSLNQSNVSLTEGMALQLTATVLPEDATDKSVTWASNNEAVATVDENGLVTAVAAGTATITATTNDGSNLAASCEITVNPAAILATSVSLDQSNVSLSEGMALQLTATVLPENATDRTVTWTSSDPAVATVDATGLVTAVAAGTATITATTNDGSNLAASCEITVEATAANRLDVQNYTVLRGNTLILPVQLVNAANNLTALQADIHLPEGITIEMDGDEYVIDLVSDRVARDHTLSSSQLASSGAVRVLIASPTKKLFKGNDGDLFTISLLTSDEMSAGDYAVTIDNIILSDNEATTYHAPDVTSTITVKDVEMGDATGDGQINVGDYVATAGYILEEDPQPFVFAAADIDANGTIDVGDLVGVAGIILSTEAPAGMPAHQAAASGTANLGVKCNRTGDGHYLVTIDMSNDASVTAMQMDLTLPDGLRLAEASLTDRASGSHAVDFNRLHNGDWRVLAASGSNKAFRDTEGAVLTLELEGDGEGHCSIENIMLARPNGARIMPDNLSFEVGLTTGITDVYSKVNIYAQGDMLIVESPHDAVAQLVMPNGMSQRLRVSAGRNVYRLGHVGYVFVKVDNQVAKFRF